MTAAQLNSTVRDGGNFFLAQPLAELRQTAAQSLTNAAYTAVTFDVEDLDTDNGHSTVTNTSRYTSQTAGRLLLGGAVSFAANATGVRATAWALNGSQVNGGQTTFVGTNLIEASVAARMHTIAVNGSTDYVELHGYQNTGAGLNTAVTAVNQSTMTVFWIHT